MTKCSTPLGGSTPVGEEKGAESEEGKAGLRCGLDKASPGSWRALNLGWPFKVIPGGSGVRAFISPPPNIHTQVNRPSNGCRLSLRSGCDFQLFSASLFSERLTARTASWQPPAGLGEQALQSWGEVWGMHPSIHHVCIFHHPAIPFLYVCNRNMYIRELKDMSESVHSGTTDNSPSWKQVKTVNE